MTSTIIPLTKRLENQLLAVVHDENLARSSANAAEPYVHEDYAAHEARIHRLVEVLADGNPEVAYRFNEALFDITHDGLDHLVRVFNDIKAEVA